MKNVFKLLTLTATTALFLAACKSDCPNNPQPCIDIDKQRGENQVLKTQLAQSLNQNVQQLAKINRVKLDASVLGKQKMSELGKLVDKIQSGTVTTPNQDANLVASIFNNLMAAENNANKLDVELEMSEAPIEDGLFLFALKSGSSQKLSLELYKEADFNLVASSEIALTAGNNYKALNVKDFELGAYILKIKNVEEGRELVQRIEIRDVTMHQ